MKRIVLLTPHFRPESNAGSHRITSLAEELVRRGWRVSVVAQLPHHPQNRIYEGFDLKSPARSVEGGIEVVRLRPWLVAKDSLALRLLSELFFCCQAFPHLLRAPAAIVAASSPYMFLGPLGLVVSRLKGVKFVWDVRDLTWLYPRAAGKKTYGLDRPIEALMRWVARRTDALTTATEGLLKYFSRRPSRTLVFANGVSDAWLEQLLEVPDPDFTGPGRVLYAGLLGYNQDLATLLEAAQLLPEVEFVLAGDGPERPKLEQLAESRGLSNVTFLGYLDHAQLLAAYQGASVLVSHLRGDPLHRWSQPSKVWEYMATGRPVIYAGEGEVVDIIDEHDLATSVPPQAPESLASAISELLNDPQRARAFGAKGRAFVTEHRRRSSLSERFVALLEDLLPPQK